MSATVAFVFPGQGSQRPGMGRDLFESQVAAREVFDRVSQAVSSDIADLCFNSDEEHLRRTENAQIALFTCGVAAYHAVVSAGIRPAATAGHSVGEYAALAAAGVLSVEEGARLVQTRGQLMADAGSSQPGTMAAVLGLERHVIEAACAEAGGVVVVANDNSPGQLVISGEVDAVGRAGELAKEKGAKRVLPLNVSGAFHSPLMAAPARQMGEALRSATFGTPTFPVYANVTAEPEATGWADLLERQLSSAVQWTQTVLNLRRDGIEIFVECGTGEVLTGLLKRIDKAAVGVSVQDSAGLSALTAAFETAGA